MCTLQHFSDFFYKFCLDNKSTYIYKQICICCTQPSAHDLPVDAEGLSQLTFQPSDFSTSENVKALNRDIITTVNSFSFLYNHNYNFILKSIQ